MNNIVNSIVNDLVLYRINLGYTTSYEESSLIETCVNSLFEKGWTINDIVDYMMVCDIVHPNCEQIYANKIMDKINDKYME